MIFQEYQVGGKRFINVISIRPGALCFWHVTWGESSIRLGRERWHVPDDIQ